jgi:conjugal transfer pilus assembly protein TraB
VKLPEIGKQLSVRTRQIGITVAVLGGVMLVVVLGLYISDPNRTHPGDQHSPQQKAAQDVVKDYRAPSQNIDPAEVWMARSEGELHEMQKANEDLSHQLAELKDQFERQHGARSNQIPIPPLPGENATGPASFPAPGSANSSPAFPKTPLPPPPALAKETVPIIPSAAANAQAQNGPRIVDVSLIGGDAVNVAKPAEASATIQDSLPTGMFTSAVLLNGLDAPTGGLAKTNPIPVLLNLVNGGKLPNRFRSRVKSCFVTGAGYGDLSSERAYIRLEKLSCVMKDEKIVDADIDGYVTGEDGKVGLRGTVVSKQGQMIARALFAGLASGLGQSIAQSYSTVSTSPLGAVQTVNPSEVAQVGVATGVGKALEKIADFYIARANELYPVIEVDSNRRGDVVLTKKVALGGVFKEAWSDDE